MIEWKNFVLKKQTTCRRDKSIDSRLAVDSSKCFNHRNYTFFFFNSSKQTRKKNLKVVKRCWASVRFRSIARRRRELASTSHHFIRHPINFLLFDKPMIINKKKLMHAANTTTTNATANCCWLIFRKLYPIQSFVHYLLYFSAIVRCRWLCDVDNVATILDTSLIFSSFSDLWNITERYYLWIGCYLRRISSNTATTTTTTTSDQW